MRPNDDGTGLRDDDPGVEYNSIDLGENPHPDVVRWVRQQDPAIVGRSDEAILRAALREALAELPVPPGIWLALTTTLFAGGFGVAVAVEAEDHDINAALAHARAPTEREALLDALNQTAASMAWAHEWIAAGEQPG